jgi:hypothetical protein
MMAYPEKVKNPNVINHLSFLARRRCRRLAGRILLQCYD